MNTCYDLQIHSYGAKQRQRGGEKEEKKLTGGEGVTAVVEQLAQRRTAIGASGLLPVDGVQ